jgi:hypothetical protein
MLSTGSTDAELGSTRGTPGILNLNSCAGSTAALEAKGDNSRKLIMVEDAMFDPYAK